VTKRSRGKEKKRKRRERKRRRRRRSGYEAVGFLLLSRSHNIGEHFDIMLKRQCEKVDGGVRLLSLRGEDGNKSKRREKRKRR